MSKEGCKVHPEESKVVSKPKQGTPTTVKEVRQLLRLLGYYRKYIPHFSQRTRCLYAQLRNLGDKNVHDAKMIDKKPKGKGSLLAKERRIIWTETHQKTLAWLID